MIQQLLQISKVQSLKSYSSTTEWSADYYQLTNGKTPFEKALIGGFTCQQFSFAFMAGYQAALAQMFPAIAPNELKALCVSEAKGGHPKAIHTTLVNHRINGTKTYITSGSDAAHLLVLCKTEEVINGRPLFKMVHLSKDTQNIEVTNFDVPFMLEVHHGKLALNDTQITDSQILVGDGYHDYTKPFRTLEDICIGAAYQAMLLRQAIDYQWESDLRDQLLLNLYTLKNLLSLPPLDKETHLLLIANEQNFENLLPSIELNIATHSPAHFKADWALNQRVIAMSKKLKAIRLKKAREVLFGDA